VRIIKRLAPALVICLLVCLATPWLIGPPCPKRLVITTGNRDGEYFACAQRYREILSRDGVSLDVRETAGSVENRELLGDSDASASLAIIQGGVVGANDCETLASLYLEPVWVFYRNANELDRLIDLRGARIAIGRPASGTRSLATLLLEENGVGTESDQAKTGTQLVDLGGQQAAEALQTGKVDAAFFVISPKVSIVRQLLETEGVRLLSFRRTAAYERKYSFLSSVTLTEGMLDLKKNIPSGNIVLLATAANLVARKGLHKAIVPLILDAAKEVHEQGAFIEEQGVFPTLQYAEGPVNDDARRYFQSGGPLFYRMLPFQLAAWLDQVKFVVLPLFTLLLPLFKAAPPIYRWRIRYKIYRWYRVLREVDARLKQSDASTNFGADISRLRELDDELADVSIPLSYMQEFYNLRLHVAYLLDKLLDRQDDATANDLPQATG
jgi:uncharacterized protein